MIVQYLLEQDIIYLHNVSYNIYDKHLFLWLPTNIFIKEFAIIWFMLIEICWALIFVAFLIFNADISDMQFIAFHSSTTNEYVILFSFFLADHILPQSFWHVRSSPFWQEQFVYLLLWYWFLDYYSQPRSAAAGYFHPPMFDFEWIVTRIICYVQFSPIL